MSSLIVKQLGGHQIGIVTQNPDGSLNIRCENPVYESELTKILNDIAQGPLVLRGGYKKQLPNGRIGYVTVAKTCQPGDPDYLHALADAITRKQVVIGGKQVRAYIKEGQRS